MTSFIQFFITNFPSPLEILLGGPPALIWAYGSLYLAGWLKRHRHLPTGYTRKIFHFLIFGAAACIQWQWGLRGVCLFGGMTSLVIFYAVWQGEGHLLYEAIAREKDAPRRTYFILIPYVATLVGGIASNLLFGPAAMVGYLVTGLADAIAEPVGTRFGKHLYRVPSLKAVPATRSLEGSLAVWLASLGALALGVWMLPAPSVTDFPWTAFPAIATLCTLVEAVSPHGWDNTTLQLIPSALVWAFTGIVA